MPDLDQQMAALREQLNALARQVNAVTEAADSEDAPGLVDTLSDMRLHLNDAAAALDDITNPPPDDVLARIAEVTRRRNELVEAASIAMAEGDDGTAADLLRVAAGHSADLVELHKRRTELGLERP
ncbi:hypothetical protein [Rhodococcus koreensis]|uniref:hypothetical protein n=1 Tax=Rhodococcus koreensis TaxID=99653 RepID=UPI003670633F